MLGFIAAAGVAVWWLLKKMNTPWLGSKNGQLELIETMHLGSRKAVHVIRAGKKQLLVGSSNEGVRLLCDLTGALETISAEAKP
jgi:flagellar biosynthetic protein FliO